MLKFKYGSTDQAVRLLEGRIRYIDNQGQVIKLEETRTEPMFKFSGYGATERLDPGQDVTQALSVEFPVEAPG